MSQGIIIGKGMQLPWKRKILEDKVCHLEKDSMHSMTTNDERFYEKFRDDCKPMKNMK